MTAPRTLFIHHCTSQPYHFFGRAAELALLDQALDANGPSVVAFIGPGGQGKTAILQEWLARLTVGRSDLEGVFLWSFYRGKDVDLCLRELYRSVEGLAHLPEVSASFCVDRLLPLLRGRRWAVLLDGAEVVQYESDAWFGRFMHPELGRLVEEMASDPQPGVLVLTTRFPLPDLERRPRARLVHLASLDRVSARGLLQSLGVRGGSEELDAAAEFCGWHAKAVELLATYLVRFQQGDAARWRSLPEVRPVPGSSDEEHRVSRVLGAFQAALTEEDRDVLALATAFRDPPTEARLLEYLASSPVETLVQGIWKREYLPFSRRPGEWLRAQVQDLVELRLLERVGRSPAGRDATGETVVIDAHPLVRRAFEHVIGFPGRQQMATARAGFLHGRPDRRRAESLAEAGHDVELFHAYVTAGLWDEADRVLTALDRPRYRFLAPAFERDLLLRFFPEGDWRRPPLWTGFHRHRALAVCFELLGRFEDALTAYPSADAPLRGDALIALGKLGPLLESGWPPPAWQMLWQSYRAHALCLAGRTTEAVMLCGRLVPGDVYEWTHVFECLLRLGQLTLLDMNSFLYRAPRSAESQWEELGRQRMRADYLRSTEPASAELDETYRVLLDAYDRGGLPWERALTRLSFARWLLAHGEARQALEVQEIILALAQRHEMGVMEADAWHLACDLHARRNEPARAAEALAEAQRIRGAVSYSGPGRP